MMFCAPVTDLSACPYELARLEAAEALFPVSADPAGLVHLSEPHFRLQAPLVGRAGWGRTGRNGSDRRLQLLHRPVQCRTQTHDDGSVFTTDALRA